MTRRFLAIVAVVLGLVVAVADMARADNIAVSGDISNPPGGARGDVQTAKLLSRAANGIGAVVLAGDIQYECGEYANFLGAYDKSWGAYKAITRPVPGNHEYLTGCAPGVDGRDMTAQEAGGAGYYRYFADQTPPHPGYYKFTYQGWDWFVINTTFGVLTPTERAAQLAWFKAAES